MSWMSGLGRILSRAGSRASRAASRISWGTWGKVGGAGGAAAVVWTGWTSLVSTVSDATGLTPEETRTSLFLIGGVLVAWIAARLILPDRGTTVVLDRDSGRRPSGSGAPRRRTVRASDGRRIR